MQKQSIEAGRHSNGVPRRFSRKKKVAAMTVATMTIAGVAFAYWTTSGTGTGTAATGDVQAVTVNQTTVVTGLAPDSTPVALTGTFDNPNAAPVEVTSVEGVVAGTSNVECLATWYQVAGTGTVLDGSVATGDGVGSWSGLTIELVNNTTVNQDACKNATVTITYNAS